MIVFKTGKSLNRTVDLSLFRGIVSTSGEQILAILKNRLARIIWNSFIFKNGNRRYKYLVLGHEEAYFIKEYSDSKNKYSEDDIIKMLEFLEDNIFVVLREGFSSR